MRCIVLCLVLMFCALVSSCIDETLFDDSLQTELVKVQFDTRLSGTVRSSISPDEHEVNDFNVYVYDRGLLVGSCYSRSDEEASISLNAGVTLNVYMLANVGFVTPLPREEDLVNRYALTISGLEDIQDDLPLSGVRKGVSVNKTEQRVCIELERLVSKIVFTVDKSALKGLEIQSVRLCQSPLAVSPFAVGGSAVSSVSDLADGDFCTEHDLELLNAGESVSFYTLENCQGVLLPDNDDPWAKLPSVLDEKSQLCTYMEVECKFSGSGLCSGNVVYRLYLGQDNCKDFNVLRNSVLNVYLCLTFVGLKESVTWRVDSDYSLNEGHASGWISRGMHNERDLYVGEKFEYGIWISEELFSYLGSDMSRCEVCFQSFDGEILENISFSEIKESDNGEYCIDATCVKPSVGEICLREKDGDILAVLSDFVSVGSPYLVVSDELYVGSQNINPHDGLSVCKINGDSFGLYVYLLDSEGLNLNTSSGCGYELDVFDFGLVADSSMNESVCDLFGSTVTLGLSGSGGPVLMLDLTCVNDGYSHPSNLALMNMCNHKSPFVWNLVETVCSLEESLQVVPESLPVVLTLVDNDWAGYGDAQIAVKVDNPSRLPLHVDYWQFITVGADYDPSLKDISVAKVENDLIINPMEYVSIQYPELSSPVYGSSCSFVSERNSFGDPAIEDNDVLVYNLEGVDTDNIIAALTYDGWGYESMSHHIEACFGDGIPVRELEVNDCLSDGSALFVAKYGEAELNDRGVWLYEGQTVILAPESRFESYRGLCPQNIITMRTQTPVVGSMSYDKYADRVFINAHALGSEGLVLDSKSKARADGYVRTYPNGTWGQAVDNYCVEELTQTCKEFHVLHGGESIIADGNLVSQIFRRIYSNTYFDSWNKIGSSNSYMHSAHPTSLVINMSFRLSDQNDMATYLFKPSFPIYVVYRHEQDGAEYTVPVDFSYQTFKFVEVMEK